MTIDIQPLGDVLGAEVRGARLGPDLSDDDKASIVAALRAHLVLCFRDQDVDAAGLRAGACVFGDPQRQLRRIDRVDGVAEVSRIESAPPADDPDGPPRVGGRTWHTDDSYFARPAKITMLHAIELPDEGGDTSFCNMYRAYDALDAAMKARFRGLRCIHKYRSTRSPVVMPPLTADEEAETPEVIHPLVRRNPLSGRDALYVNPNRMEQIVGLERAESDAILDDLAANCPEPEAERVYRHRWRLGDVVVWDNRCTMHRVSSDVAPGAHRLMHRVLVEGEVPLAAD